jgi:hypothetical protein
VAFVARLCLRPAGLAFDHLIDAAANATTTDVRTVPATTDVRLANRYAASRCT